MIIDTYDLALQDASHLMTDIVVPRPIAWVSTVDENGVYNLAKTKIGKALKISPKRIEFFVAPQD